MGRRLKRVLLGALAAAVLLPLAACAQFALVGPLRNDRAAGRLLEELLADVELPPGASAAETAAWAGNPSGTGNHVKLWAAILAFGGGGAPLDRDAPTWERPGPATADLEELFPLLAELDDWDGYSLYETYGDAATQWDLRGH